MMRRSSRNVSSDPVAATGNPAIGPLWMQAEPTLAIKLPFTVPAWEDDHGQVWLGHNSVTSLARRHRVATEVVAALPGVAGPIAIALGQPS